MTFLAATKQLYKNTSVRPSVCLSVCHTFFTMFLSLYVSSWNFQKLLPMTKVISIQKVKVRGQSAKRCPIIFQGHLSNFKVTRLKNRQFLPKLGISRLEIQFEFTNGSKMMHKAWSSIEEVPYCFSRPCVKFQGHTAKKNHQFRPKLRVSRL